MSASPTFWIYVSKWTVSPASIACMTSPSIWLIVVCLGDKIAVTSASGPVLPSASVVFLSSNSDQSSATSEVLASMMAAKIIGVNLLIVISSKMGSV